MTPNQSHLAGLELALQQWNNGGPSAHFATQLSDLVAQAKAAPADPATGTEQVSSTWLAQLREEYLTFGSECQRLTAENARLRQHKTEYMEAAEETSRALSDRLTELEAKQADHSAHDLNMVAPVSEAKARGGAMPDERSAFEKWGETLFFSACFERHGNDEYAGRGLQGAWLGWQARAALSTAPPPSAVPDGWKIVPIEPSEAIREAIDLLCDDHGAFDDSEAFWNYLLAAAPSPASQKEGRNQ